MAKDYDSYTFKNKAIDNIQSRTNTANDPDDKPSKKVRRLAKRSQKAYDKADSLEKKQAKAKQKPTEKSAKKIKRISKRRGKAMEKGDKLYMKADKLDSYRNRLLKE